MSKFQEIVGLETEARSAQSKKDFERAIQALGRGLEIARDINRPRLSAVLFMRLGEVLETSGQIQRSVIAYESGLNALQGESGSSLDPVIASLRSAVKGFDPAHEFMEVLDLYTEAAAEDMVEAEKDHLLAVKLLINTGNAYLRQPQMTPALNAYEQALQRPEISDAPVLRAHALTHIAIIQRRSGKIESAEDALHEALAILEQHPDPTEKRRALVSLAGIFREKGELITALTTYQQALGFYEQADDPLGEARTQASLGHIYLEQHENAAAKGSFQRAVDLAQQVGDEDTLWHAYWGLGRCQHMEGELDEAVESFRQCIDKIKYRQHELRTDEGKVTFLESVQDIYDHLIAVQLNRAVTISSAYKEALDTAEEARGQALYELMGVRRRRFQTRQTGIRDSRTQPFPDRFNPASQQAAGVNLPPQQFNMMAQMAPAVQSAPSTDLVPLLDDPVWSEDIIGISDMVENAQAVPSTVPRWSAAENVPTVDENLPKPVPLPRLVFHLLKDRTAVFAVEADGTVHGHTVALGEDAVSQKVNEIRQALDVDVFRRDVFLEETPGDLLDCDVDYIQLLRSFYSSLIEPVEAVLPVDGTPIVIEPHGALWLLPFAALMTSPDSYLVDRWPILFSPSFEVLDEIRREPDYGRPGEMKPLIVGNPKMPAVPNSHGVQVKLKPLPGAEEESRFIFNLFQNSQGRMLLGESADWASVIAQIPQHGILHFATHGLAYSDKPLDSLIVLGQPSSLALKALEEHPAFNTWTYNNFLQEFIPEEAQKGFLTARQIVYLPIPADLVTLSACQTGLGQISGDGMIGLSRSFLVAGARSVLVSQWSVSDQATADLMAAFYQGYIERDDKAYALQNAMRMVRSKPEYVHPRYWASFVVVGAEA